MLLNDQNHNSYFFFFYYSNLFPNIFNYLLLKDGLLYLSIKSKYLIFFINFIAKHSFSNFKQLLDIWGIDYPSRNKRFEVNYLLISNLFNIRLIVRVSNGLYEGLPSVTHLFESSNWLEREVWDMFGIYFFNNSDLRRILTDYGFEGFPLRKDFPLSGYSEIRYDFESKRIVFDKLELTQEFRSFDYNNNWLGR